jgi:simple sugar transport system substrate-binding protein
MKHVARLAFAALMFGAATAVGFADGLKDPKDVKIAFVVHGNASDAYWSVVKRGVEDAAKLTGAQVQYLSPQTFDEVEHARLIEAAIATHPDGIAVSIPDAAALKGPVEKAIAAGIPVVNLDSGEKEGESMGVTYYVGTTSEYEAGLRAGERLATKDGVLHVACVNHEVGNVSLDQRCQGVNDGLAKHGGSSEVIATPEDPGEITRRTEAYLSAHPEIQGVFATGTGAAAPLIKYFRDRELFGKLKLYSFDIGPEILDSVAAGEMGFGIDGQQYLMGYLPVLVLVENATHGLWPQNNTYTGPLFVDTPEKAKAILTLSKEGIR